MANLEQEEQQKREKSSVPVSDLVQATVTASESVAKGPLPCLIPSFDEACNLVRAPYSCLVVDTHRRHVALSPMYLKKKKTGIQEQLGTDLLKYSESLKGVPVAYDNIRVLGQYGDIYDDQGYIHMNIEADFVVFRPNKGQKLVGIVNKVAPSHIGCLVHGCFNASLPKPHKMFNDACHDSGLKVGDRLEFEVYQLDADVAGVLLIRGKLDENSVLGKLVTQQEECTVDQDNVNGEPDAIEEMPSKKKKKKKGKKRAKEDLESSVCTDEIFADSTVNREVGAIPEGSSVNGDSSVNGGILDMPKKKKKKKLDKEPELASQTECHASDSSGSLSHSKRDKKRKLSDGGDLIEPTLAPRAKKKRKE
ncbi:DNA-directed RNA polymerase I subunit RPA43 [Huso huso]|uniref:DNA-directed RNA polymerase subunit n=1 Tax=Huso huso TaxID=61971 RepID=A0ABR1A3M3_HUSHU